MRLRPSHRWICIGRTPSAGPTHGVADLRIRSTGPASARDHAQGPLTHLAQTKSPRTPPDVTLCPSASGSLDKITRTWFRLVDSFGLRPPLPPGKVRDPSTIADAKRSRQQIPVPLDVDCRAHATVGCGNDLSLHKNGPVPFSVTDTMLISACCLRAGVLLVGVVVQ